MQVIEKAILLFREQGKTGERFSDTIERLGFENVQSQLLGSELLKKKGPDHRREAASGRRRNLLISN